MPALVLAGHGSHRNPDSARPVFDHADRLRDRFSGQDTAPFDEVHEAFWKEEPALGEVLRTVASDEIVVVPLFMAAGYFVREVLPRELRLTGDRNLDVDATVHYADPVGTHDAMTDVVVERAERVLDVAPESAGLAVVGHGTERNEHSAETTRYHAERVRECGDFAAVEPLFMDEDPEIDDLTDHFDVRDVAVVPLFLADGYHTREDIPEDVGLTDDHREGWPVPATVEGHRVWYAGAVGTEPLLADVALERGRAALDGDARITVAGGDDGPPARASDAEPTFREWLEIGSETREWGQLAVSIRHGETDGERDDYPRYELRHVDDRGESRDELDHVSDPRDLRELTRFDGDGDYRPLAGKPSLRSGWILDDLGAEQAIRAVETVYPASVANWAREQDGDLGVTHFRETAARQTGIYDVISDLDREQVADAARACCAASECVKRREWEYDEGEALFESSRGASPRDDSNSETSGGGRTDDDATIPCREPCSLFVAAARAFVREDERGSSLPATGSDPDTRIGNVAAEDNRLRARYRECRRARKTDAEPEPGTETAPDPERPNAGQAGGD